MTKIYFVFIALLCTFFNDARANSFYNTENLKKNLNRKNIDKNISVFTLDNFSSFTDNDPETNKEIGKAIGAFGELEKNGNFTNTINPNELTVLPIGLRENKSNVEYGIVITKAKFTPEYAIINVYARVVTPQAGSEGGKKTLYFGAEGVKLSYNGRIIGDAKLSLLGDINIPFNQDKWMLTLEGGKINKYNGESINDNTYVVIDCNGIKELSLKGNIQISREVLVPLKENGEMADPTITINGKIVANRVRGDFALKASDWNDLLVKVNITPFAITKQTQDKDKGYFSFFVNNAILDLSDLRTDASVVFPQHYLTQGYLVAGTETWRGLYVQSLYVGLPQEFKTEDHIDSRVSFQAQNLLIDSYGVSGSFSANNIFPLERGITSNQNAWRYSLDQIGVDLAASKIVAANLKGKVQLPVQKQNDDNQNNSIPTYLGYQGMITEEQYLISVTTLSDINFDIWSAKATIASGSSIEMRVKNREFLPKAILHGSLAIGANGDPSDNSDPNAKKDADFKGVKFEGLTLQTKAPFITAQYFGVQGEQKLAGFPASIKNIFVEADNGYANLGFEITVGLQEERFSASGGMKINGLIVNENNRQRWKYDGFSLTKLALNNVDIGVATVSGSLQIMRKDPLYGNGFMASLSAKDIKGLKNAVISVNAAFGYSTFRYWGFDGSVDGLKIPAGLIDITGFTGGAFYHMVPDRDMSMLHKERPLVLKPDNTVGLALRAGVYGAVKDKNVASFMAGFNISTNPNGGLANIGFVGETVIMSDITAIAPAPFAKVQEKFRDMAGKSKFLNDLKDNPKVNSFLDTNKIDENYPLEVTVPSAIYGKMAMNYDFNNSVFHASLEVYVNAAGGVIKGIGQNGRAGWAVLHIAPDDWYMHIGTPSDMIGLRVGFGNFSLQSGSYFMVGNHIPGSPPPPIEVAQILGLQLNDIDYMKDLNDLGDGKGFAFGTHLKFDTGDMTALFLYARFQAGLGTDIMLKNYGEARCSNRGGDKIGINGWYANGQAYVYLQGELGIKIKLWFVNKKIPIIKAGAAALLQAKGPNPYWARGYLGGYYNLLGGMVKGRFRFKMEFGEECKFENASVLGGMKIITDLTPKNEDANIDVFAIPQATFALRVNEPIVIPEDDGDHTYKVLVEKMTIIDDQGKEIKGTIEYTNSKDVANFVSDDILPPSKTLKALVQVSFMEKKGGMYQVVLVDGKKAIEVEERTFTTGSAPNVIPLSNIKFAYPVVEQENYYSKESNNGYVKLKRGQDYLFDDPNWTTKTVFAADTKIETNFSYDINENTIKFTIPNLNKQKNYTFALIAKNKNGSSLSSVNQTEEQTVKTEENEEESGVSVTTEVKKAQNLSKDGEIDRLSFVFRTSKYNTFSDKLSALHFSPLWLKVSSDVVMLQNNMNADEYFDITELTGTKYTDNKPLIHLTALMDDAFAAKFKNLFYDGYPIDQLTLNRAEDEEDVAGIPPVKAFSVFTSYLQYLGNDKGNGFLKQTFPYKYDLFRFYKADWYELVSKAASKYVGSPASARPQGINALLQSNYGIIPTIKYKVKAKYMLPGDKQGTEKQINYEFK